jgi:hypothetical protein
MSDFTVVKLLDRLNPTIITGGFVPRGAYDNATDYAVGDSVDYNGSSYVMYADAVAGTLPTDTNYWQVVANGGVSSVNTKSGIVVIDPDDLDDTATTNKFTTAGEITKLSGIETGADVTDTANVTSAGALMDFEVTSLSGVKSLTVPDSTTISAFGATLTDDSDAATARTTLGVDAAGTDNSTDVTLGTNTATALSLSGQELSLADVFVQLAGDTMTGDLIFSGAQKIIGGTGTTSDLTLQTTSGVGATGADMHFLVGNNGATEAMTILNSGNVGIGTTAPQATLDIVHTNNAAGGIRLQDNLTNATTKVGRIKIGHYTNAEEPVTAMLIFSTSVSNEINYGGGSGTENAATALNFYTGATTTTTTGTIRMMVNSAGNVGIGTTSPVAKLDVSTNAAFDSKTFTIGNSTSDANERLRLFYDGGVARAKFTGASGVGLGFGTGGTDDRMVINASGNVGIGTTAPNSRLEVVGSGAQTIVLKAPSPGSGSSIVFADGGTPTKYNWLAGSQYNINNAFEITPSTTVGGSTFTTPALTVLQNGNTGIGTTAPAMKLDVTGTGRISSTLYLGTGTTKYLRENGTDIQMINTDSGGLDFRTNGMSFNYNNGSTGSLTWYGGDTTADFFISNTGQGYFSGNVGIGTTVPTNLLSLGGNSARTFWMERHTTANSAGNTLTITAGGATSGATNKAGGNLILQGGLSTGNAESGVIIQGDAAGASGTSDGTQTTMIQVLGNKVGLFGVTPVVRPAAANQAALTNSTGGTYDGTLVDVGVIFNQANINNNFTDIHTLLTEIRTALVNIGAIKGSA